MPNRKRTATEPATPPVPATFREYPTCISILVVGRIGVPWTDTVNDQFRAFQEQLGLALREHFPDFQLAHPGLTISTFELRDDWIGWQENTTTPPQSD